MSKFNKKVFPGAVFDRLTVVERIPHSGGRVRCRCECGRVTTPSVTHLVNGTTSSCGCGQAAKPGKGYGRVVPGATFDRLTVVERVRENNRWTGQVRCACLCGNMSIHNIDGLVRGIIRSCGCLNREMTAARNTRTARHKGFSSRCPKTWASWQAMVTRCYNKKYKAYAHYGAKGVRACAALRSHPQNVVKAIGVRKGLHLTIDRFPIHDGNYTCGRCKECKQNGWKLNIRWATRREQNNNKGDYNVMITAFGKTMTKMMWMRESGLSWSCLTGRLRRGWDVERALTTPDPQGHCFRPPTV